MSRILANDVCAKNIDWHKWGLAKNKKPVKHTDGFLYCCKVGIQAAKKDKTCRYHNAIVRDRNGK